MTKPRVSTVVDHFADYNYDESEECIDGLFSKLDLAKDRTVKEATDLANAKEASLGHHSGLFAHMQAAQVRLANEKLRLKKHQ
jgi:hypothetical protein